MTEGRLETVFDLLLKPGVDLYCEFSYGARGLLESRGPMVLFCSEFSFLPAKVVSAAAAASVGVRRVP